MGRKASANTQAALDRAQEIVYKAWDANTTKRRIELAEKALATSLLCADAYVLLAQHAKEGSDAELDLWQRGMEAGETALGKAAFEEFEGMFWGFLETRPYMRARFGLAHALWQRGVRDEAMDHLRAMLHLNPEDNQGVRYVLAAWLLEAGRDTDLSALLQEYPEDDMAAWSWTAALTAFRRNGDNAESRRLLAAAQATNEHVLRYLLGDRQLPKRLPPYISPGEDDEAVHYVSEFHAGWALTQGAIDWLRTQAAAPQAPKRRGRRSEPA
jgi:tetratricopeptide (TPR) repeat protein